MFPLICSRTTSGSRSWPSRSTPTAEHNCPGVQYPHWKASCSMNASWIGCSSPSTVVTSEPSQATASARHAFTRRPSSSTVHAPHWPWSQPFLAPMRSSCSRSRSRSDVRVSTVTARRSPLTPKVMAASNMSQRPTPITGGPSPRMRQAGNGHDRAVIGGEFEAAAHRLYELLGDGQAEPRARLVGAEALEGLKRPRGVRDPRPVVAHDDPAVLARDVDAAADRRVLDRVADEVQQRLAQPLRVRPRLARARQVDRHLALLG